MYNKLIINIKQLDLRGKPAILFYSVYITWIITLPEMISWARLHRWKAGTWDRILLQKMDGVCIMEQQYLVFLLILTGDLKL